MRRFKGNLEVLFMIALALLLLLGFVGAGLMHRVSLVSYEEKIDLAIMLDNAGSGLLGLLNSGEVGLKHMETLGSSAAKSQAADFDKDLIESLENLKMRMMQKGYSLKVLVSGEEVKTYGAEPPEGAAMVEADILLPCKEGGDCKGRVRLGAW